MNNEKQYRKSVQRYKSNNNEKNEKNVQGEQPDDNA